MRDATPTPHVVHLDRARFGLALQRLAKKNGKVSDNLFAKLVHAWEGRWGTTHMRSMVTVRLTSNEYDHLQTLRIPLSPIECAHWKATYAHPETPSQTEVTITSATKPPVRKTLRVSGGNRKLIRTSLRELTASERSITMARVKPKTETAPDDDDILAGLEDLEDDVEPDEDDDDLEDEAPKAKPQSARAKRAAARKAAKAAEVEDDEDDDDEDEAPAPRRSRKPAAKTAGRKKPTPPAAKALPAGKLSASDIAEQAGVTGRDVRMYLRKNNVPVDAELGRYAFTAAQAKKIVAAITKSRKG